jgi:hypothetical protein
VKKDTLEKNDFLNNIFIYFDSLSKRVANLIILLFISKLIAVVLVLDFFIIS